MKIIKISIQENIFYLINNDNYYKCIIVTEPMYDYDHCTSFIFNKMFYL